MLGIEAQGVDLRMEQHIGHAQSLGLLHEALKHPSSKPGFAVCFSNSHAANAAIGQQSARCKARQLGIRYQWIVNDHVSAIAIG
jgi:hypothetical protein